LPLGRHEPSNYSDDRMVHTGTGRVRLGPRAVTTRARRWSCRKQRRPPGTLRCRVLSRSTRICTSGSCVEHPSACSTTRPGDNCSRTCSLPSRRCLTDATTTTGRGPPPNVLRLPARRMNRRTIEHQRVSRTSTRLPLRRRCGSAGATSALAEEEAPAADGPSLMLCQGLRVRGSPGFALSRWTSWGTTPRGRLRSPRHVCGSPARYGRPREHRRPRCVRSVHPDDGELTGPVASPRDEVGERSDDLRGRLLRQVKQGHRRSMGATPHACSFINAREREAGSGRSARAWCG
jgi:hypothetical protein